MGMNVVTDLWNRHGWVLIFVVWPIISMLLNALLRKKSPEAWVEYGKKNPRTAALIRFLSAVGFDPAKAMRAFQQFIKGASAAAHTTNPKAAAIIDAVTEDEKKEEPKS